MVSRSASKCLIALVLGLFLASSAWAGQWAVLGPDGGDVRSLSYNPKNPDQIYLGTSTGSIFMSKDGGHNWSRFAHVGAGDDYVLDHIAVDANHPDTIYVAAWSVENQQAGDLFRSKNGGKSWEALPGMHACRHWQSWDLAPVFDFVPVATRRFKQSPLVFSRSIDASGNGQPPSQGKRRSRSFGQQVSEDGFRSRCLR